MCSYFLIIACSEELSVKELNSPEKHRSFKNNSPTDPFWLWEKKKKPTTKGFSFTLQKLLERSKDKCLSLNIVRPTDTCSVPAHRKPPGLFQHLHRKRLKTCRSAPMQRLKGAVHTHLSTHTACIWIIRHKRVKITPNSVNRWSVSFRRSVCKQIWSNTLFR